MTITREELIEKGILSDRKKDRHKDKHRKRNRSKPAGEKRKSVYKTRQKKEWDGDFVVIDGEGWDGKYTLLAISHTHKYAYNPHGLSTLECLDYILKESNVTSKHAWVGFGLSYDFENILCDIPDEDYQTLLAGDPIVYQGYTISYIPRKILEIKAEIPKRNGIGTYRKMVTIQDVHGFFQTSFIGAMQKWGIKVPKIITEGKEARGDFKVEDFKWIKKYNDTELDLLVQLMRKLKEADQKAFERIGLLPNHTNRIWYGPGTRASNFLLQTYFREEHPDFTGPVMEKLKNLMPDAAEQETHEAMVKSLTDQYEVIEKNNWIVTKVKDAGFICSDELYESEIKSLPVWVKKAVVRKTGWPFDIVANRLGLSSSGLLDRLTEAPTKAGLRERAERLVIEEVGEAPCMVSKYPFAAAYYGGRIEAAGSGELETRLYDYDINSAYPYAISLLPKWTPNDLLYVEGFDELHRMGMYFVRWNIKEDCNFYPFPYRKRNGNVFFPRAGSGWYMSPEVEAAYALFGSDIEVLHGFVVADTDGAGDGLSRLPEDRLSLTAIKTKEMADIRLIAKAEGGSEEKSLKLILNSEYGKTIQQIGTHKFLNPFCASWITSVCRALILWAVGRDTENNVISIMTDGILTRKPLEGLAFGKELGQFECTEFDRVVQLMPGIYQLENFANPKESIKRYRGMGKDFSFIEGLKVLNGAELKIQLRVFVTRSLALHMPNKFGKLRYQFVDIEKDEKFSLKSKRRGDVRLKEGQTFTWLPAQELDPLDAKYTMSQPYRLAIAQTAELAYDTAQTMDELVDDRRLGSILSQEELG